MLKTEGGSIRSHRAKSSLWTSHREQFEMSESGSTFGDGRVKTAVYIGNVTTPR